MLTRCRDALKARGCRPLSASQARQRSTGLAPLLPFTFHLSPFTLLYSPLCVRFWLCRSLSAFLQTTPELRQLFFYLFEFRQNRTIRLFCRFEHQTCNHCSQRPEDGD